MFPPRSSISFLSDPSPSIFLPSGRVRIVDREERIKIRQTWGGYDDLTDSYTPPWEAEHEAKQEDKQDHDQQEACARRRAIPPRGPLGQPGESQENGMSEMTEEEKEAQEHALRKQSVARQKAEEAIRRRKMERETGVRRKRSPPPPSGFGELQHACCLCLCS